MYKPVKIGSFDGVLKLDNLKFISNLELKIKN